MGDNGVGVEGGKQRAEDRGQRAEDRGQRTEGRNQTSEKFLPGESDRARLRHIGEKVFAAKPLMLLER